MFKIYFSIYFSLITILILYLLNLVPLGIYLIPLTFCGIITTSKLVEFSKNENATKDVFFYVWSIFFLSSFIAPLIHFSRNYWIEHVYTTPSDWKYLAFQVSSIYLVGIMIFYLFSKVKTRPKRIRYFWAFKSNASTVVFVLMLFSLLLQTYLYMRLGGIHGYILRYTERNSGGGFSGMGTLFLISELFPYFLLLWYFIKNRGKQIKLINVILFLIILLLSCIYFGGLRGSRSNTIFTVFQALIVIHFTLYRFKRIHFLLFIAAFFLYMTVGRIYKTNGIGTMEKLSSLEDLRISNQLSSIESIIITDLTRYNIMCYELYMFDKNSYFEYKYGSTYLYSALTFIPYGKYIRDYLGVEGRTDAAGELQYDYDGVGRSNNRKNTRIFGFIGESMLNFSPYIIILAFIILYYILAYISYWVNAIPLTDARFFIASTIVIIVPLIINADSSNVIFTIIKRPLPLLIVLYLITNRITYLRN